MAGTVMQIHCPGCGVRLSVPMDAGGRPARCPACKTRFRVPDPRAMLDETVTCWLDLDNLDRDDEREKVMDHRDVMDQLNDAAPPPIPTPQPRAWSQAPAPKPTQSRLPAEPDSKSQPPAPPLTQKPQHVESTAGGHLPTQRVVRKLVDRSSPQSPSSADGSSPPPHKRMVKFAPAPKPDAFTPTEDDAFAKQPHLDALPVARQADDSPENSTTHLRVVSVGTYGVKITFNAHLLDNPAFRGSMPMMGMVALENDPAKLIARPLAWTDRATGKFPNPGELEARYELHLRPHQTPQDVLDAMSVIDQLTPPFNQPMPYYISRDEVGSVRVNCLTISTQAGILCEVTIPSVRYALEWIGRVNGVCSAEYIQLQHEVNKLEAGAWQTIPSQVRHRLAVWFDFQPQEKFLGYFNDADFARSDAGLAGLVLTDKRLVYCKHHYHGSITLADGGSLIAVEEGRFATLYYSLHTKRRKLINMRREEVEQLAEILAQLEAPIEMLVEAEEPVPSDDASNQDVHPKLA